MGFYDLSKENRVKLVAQIKETLLNDFKNSSLKNVQIYFADDDTYIRKAAYLSVGRVFIDNKSLQSDIINGLKQLLKEPIANVRQTVINSAGEIGKCNFEIVQDFFDIGLFDEHHSVRNAVIGSMKKMGEKNPVPVLNWSKRYLHHEDKEIRREICHGIELRGRTHPQDILPLLKELEFDKTARVRNTLIHVLGQIAYKKGCLQTVISDLNSWENKEVVSAAIEEIIDVHYRYRNFSVLTQQQAIAYIQDNFKNK